MADYTVRILTPEQADGRYASIEALDDMANTPMKNDRDNGQAGIMAPTAQILSESSAAATSGRVYIARFVPSRDMTIRSIAFEVTSASATNDPVEVGILNATATEKLGSSGSVSGILNSGNGVKSVNMASPIELESGTVYYAFWLTTSSGTAASIRRANVFADLFGSGVGVAESMGATSKTIPLATPVTGLVQNDTTPFLGLKEYT